MKHRDRQGGGNVAPAATRLSRVDPFRGTVGDLLRKARPFGYGFVAQACSAATTFGLVVIAAHVLGPAGLGTMSIGFGAYLVVLGLTRGLLTTPLVTGSAAHDSAERALTARFGLTALLLAVLPASAVLVAAGIALPERFGLGMLLFAPWLGAALVQDLGRSVLFRDRGGASLVLSDATWLLTLTATTPIALHSRTSWAVVACWGMGAVAGAAVVLGQIRLRPAPIGQAIRWWRSHAWPFGRWLLLSGTLYSAVSFSSALALVGILGAKNYGGLRAVESVFGPLTLIGPAIALPGLPVISRAVAASPRRAIAIAWKLAGVASLLTAAYLVILYSFPGVIGLLFGEKFDEFRSIVVPVGIGQLVAAPALGLTLLLTSQQRGRTLLWVGTLTALAALSCSATLASIFGLVGAAWGGALGSGLGLIFLITALRRSQAPLSPPTTRAPGARSAAAILLGPPRDGLE